MLSTKKILGISNQLILTEDLSDDDLVEFCILANEKYRSGSPIISDENYDFIFISVTIPNFKIPVSVDMLQI